MTLRMQRPPKAPAKERPWPSQNAHTNPTTDLSASPMATPPRYRHRTRLPLTPASPPRLWQDRL